MEIWNGLMGLFLLELSRSKVDTDKGFDREDMYI